MSCVNITIPSDDELSVNLTIGNETKHFELVILDALAQEAMDIVSRKGLDSQAGAWLSEYGDLLKQNFGLTVSDGQALMIHHVVLSKLGAIQKKLSDSVSLSGTSE